MERIQANIDKVYLPLYEALASEVRLRILALLGEKPMNVKDLAQQLGLSSAIVTMHVRKLEKGGLTRSRMIRKEGGTHKMNELAVRDIGILLPHAKQERVCYETVIPVGHYTSFEAHPTCGLATPESVIGQFDDPRYFLEPERMHAKILWLGRGYVEYKIPNYLLPGQQITEISFAMEIGSEAPGYNNQWPSDICFSLNDKALGLWTSPGDYGGERGTFTPGWWPADINQYGLLKILRIREDGTYLDGQRMSDVGLRDIPVDRNFWTFRLAVDEASRHVGGLTLYGAGFGNYNQDIVFRLYYEAG